MTPGNLLLVHSKLDPVAWLIQKVTKCKWNHIAGILSEDSIIEVTTGGIKISKISKYNNWFYETKEIKIKSLETNRVWGCFINEQAYIENNCYRKYTLPVSFTFLAIALGFKPNRSTCSGYIANILNYLMIRFAPGQFKLPEYITPADIANSNQVEDATSDEELTEVANNIKGTVEMRRLK